MGHGLASGVNRERGAWSLGCGANAASEWIAPLPSPTTRNLTSLPRPAHLHQVANFLSNLPAYRTGVSPLTRGVEVGLPRTRPKMSFLSSILAPHRLSSPSCLISLFSLVSEFKCHRVMFCAISARHYVEVGLAHGFFVTGPFIKLGPLRMVGPRRLTPMNMKVASLSVSMLCLRECVCYGGMGHLCACLRSAVQLKAVADGERRAEFGWEASDI